MALCGAALHAGAARADGPLPCSGFLKGYAAGDKIVLNEAARMAQRLIDSAWSSPAMRAEEDPKEGQAPTAKGRRDLVLRQLQRNCLVMPQGEIQHIVGVLIRTANLSASNLPASNMNRVP